MKEQRNINSQHGWWPRVSLWRPFTTPPSPPHAQKTTPWNTPNHRRRIKRRPLPLLLSLSFFYAPTPQTHCPPWVGKFKRQEEGWMLTLRRDAWALAVCAFRVETSFISVSIFRISSFISPPSSSSSPLHPSPLETLLAGGGRSMVDCQERRHCYNILYSTVNGQFRYHVRASATPTGSHDNVLATTRQTTIFSDKHRILWRQLTNVCHS